MTLPAKETGQVATPPPIAMLAELTHRCPLACPYCSNPLELARANEELSTSEWIETFRQAAALGVLHLHLSGGEPASRRDLIDLTKAAVSLGLYTNLITSGIGLTEARVDKLSAAGLDHVQLSIQGTRAPSADHVSGCDGGHARKLSVAGWLRDAGIPLTLNAVCHRRNMGEIEDIISLAIELGARRVEIATVQFHGWAMLNQKALMPTMDQVAKATSIVETMRARLEGVLVIDYVPADYYATYPKACMGGWGRAGFNVTPSGRVLPCHAAETIKHLAFDNVRARPLGEIWYNGGAFNAFRGDGWMPEPCRSCERKDIDFGGCRCQAMALAGDASATDPVCRKSPHRKAVDRRIIDDTEVNDTEVRDIEVSDIETPRPPFRYRGNGTLRS
ncbi:pyrroloquinoline quinone biosynthesis protein PqqE [Nitrobacter winogradskyi]|uniref:PqqA peptide cyclase n=2 Tax=Nitrobacter winogradskyi TaxID=913 RepID=A0A4Y3WDE6_NITWI|nr:pyrroloquinoline quinone biosynthesis protein PqqE [Nitrobacter winogradskyi]MCP2000840.1 pyrroloquinoline quinone biosynthesis protein E [Nitrobacter winogradskyi]GEC17057.1 coenzyme PQQ synthesis protein E [Nitrobacter winogradskyi]